LKIEDRVIADKAILDLQSSIFDPQSSILDPDAVDAFANRLLPSPRS
jgi:hypothetical protein